MSRQVVVVGAGVIGLTSALALAEAGHSVRVVAGETGAGTTSYAAGAMVSPPFGSEDERLHRWAAATRLRMLELAEDPASGVRCMPTLLACRMNVPVPPESADLDDLHTCAAAELPDGFALGLRAVLPFVAMPAYLGWLTDRLHDHHVEVELGWVSRLDHGLDQTDTVVNCSGVGARELAGDDQVQPDRGQHVIVRNPGIDSCFYEIAFDGAWASWMVHGDVVVLGGLSTPGDERREPDPQTAAEIVARCAAIEPRFVGAEVLEHRVGLRPSRPSVRLEAEERAGGRVVHCYGHGGMGVALSYGSALDVVAQVEPVAELSDPRRRRARPR